MSMPLTPGTLLQNRYRIGRVIGKGGMGDVYEVMHEQLNVRMALKRIIRDETALLEGFENEARLLASLSHPALPRVTDYFSDGDIHCIVMEYIDGQDLSQILHQRGAIPFAQVLQWAEQLLDVLIYLHMHQPQIIHRDIKPQNIKINEQNRVILLDFGIAKGRASVGTTSSTEHSISAYSRHYAAPEQIFGSGTDQRSDLFSLGATLYHALTNRQPVDVYERLAKINEGAPDPLQPANSINSGVPTGIGEVIQRVMQLNAAVRYNTAAELRKALTAAATPQQSALVSAETELTATPAPPKPPSLRAGPSQPQPQPPAAKRSSSPGARQAPALGAAQSLPKRIKTLVNQTLSRDGDWMVWCDPRGEWQPLLERVAAEEGNTEFPLLIVNTQTSGAIGGLQVRQEIQRRLEARQKFVLLVAASPDQLGWVWAHALIAEQTYTTSLRAQLQAWGWQPQSATISDEEITVIARQNFSQDPADWGGGSLEPDPALLLDVLAAGTTPEQDNLLLLYFTIERSGLPPINLAALEQWRIRVLARLLVTQAYEQSPGLISATHELLIAEPQRPAALDLLNRWIDSLRLSKGLPAMIVEADKIAALTALVQKATLNDGPFLSHAAEHTLFARTCLDLSQKHGKELLDALDRIAPEVAAHGQSFWGTKQPADHPSHATIAWDELARLSQAATMVLKVAPTTEWPDIGTAIAWYTNDGWSLDVAGEAILRNLTPSTPELIALIAPLREAYRSRWEKTLIQWSDTWLASGCAVPQLDTAGTWLAQALTNARSTAIVVIDALRYDLGTTLVKYINQHEGTDRATLKPARAPLPSITALGMGMALPIAEAQLQADFSTNGWRLIETQSQKNLRVAAERRAWLRDRGIIDDGFLELNELLEKGVAAPTKAGQRLFITDRTIDKLGHDDELEIQGSSTIVERYYAAISQLREARWHRILIVTDHGYIHWSGSNDTGMSPPVPGPSYRSRRALAYPTQTTVPVPHAYAPGNQWKVVPARGATNWIAYGGLGYFHGGASLQEWIIPCIQVEWPAKGKPVQPTIQPVEHILSVRPRITVLIEREKQSSEELLPRKIEVIIRHATERTILFRSAATELNPAGTEVPIMLTMVANADAAWDSPLRIEVRDLLTEEILAAIDSTLRARLDEW